MACRFSRSLLSTYDPKNREKKLSDLQKKGPPPLSSLLLGIKAVHEREKEEGEREKEREREGKREREFVEGLGERLGVVEYVVRKGGGGGLGGEGVDLLWEVMVKVCCFCFCCGCVWVVFAFVGCGLIFFFQCFMLCRMLFVKKNLKLFGIGFWEWRNKEKKVFFENFLFVYFFFTHHFFSLLI